MYFIFKFTTFNMVAMISMVTFAFMVTLVAIVIIVNIVTKITNINMIPKCTVVNFHIGETPSLACLLYYHNVFTSLYCH